MTLNFLQIFFLFCLAIPGIIIAVPRLINYLLPQNSEGFRSRVSRLAVIQTLIMAFIASLTGSAIATKTGLTDSILTSWFQNPSLVNLIKNQLFPVLLVTLVGTFIFLSVYNFLIPRLLDSSTLLIMKKIRLSLGFSACVLYGGITEEILLRWGLMNIIIFFALLFGQPSSPFIVSLAILISGFMHTFGQLPLYIAAGCQRTRFFIYSLMLLYEIQAILFGYIFWQYGIIAAIMSHMLFHALWYLFSRKDESI